MRLNGKNSNATQQNHVQISSQYTNDDHTYKFNLPMRQCQRDIPLPDTNHSRIYPVVSMRKYSFDMFSSNLL